MRQAGVGLAAGVSGRPTVPSAANGMKWPNPGDTRAGAPFALDGRMSHQSAAAAAPGPSEYAAMQRAFYDTHARSLDDARALVHPDFSGAQIEAVSSQAHVLLDFMARNHARQPGGTLHDVVRAASTLPPRLRALDFGCGVGRLMVPMAAAGFDVDGVDISERMLEFAASHPGLERSRFFRSSGSDCGAAPDGAYDLVYSSLCLQHICSRTVRSELLASFARALTPGGVMVVQMHFYPGHNAWTVPSPHVPWSADAFDAKETNSGADVWATPDELALVYADVARHFEDVRFQFVTIPGSGHLIVSGSTAASLASRLYAR